MLSVRFWGVRGSIACPGPDTVIYGGNTSCLEIRADERLIIIDLGTGVRGLGDRLLRQIPKNGPVDADIFITHTHWDHIMGFPVFGPIFVPTTKLRIRGPVNYEDGALKKILSNKLSYDYWPVRLSELAAHIEFGQMKETTLDLGGGLTVTSKYLNHSILCLGYRFEYQGKSIVTAYDTEPFSNPFPTDRNDQSYDESAALEGAETAREENERFLDFIKYADVLVYDSMYTEKEYRSSKIGWGHSSLEEAIKNSRRARIKKLVCFHHDPGRTDKQLEAIERRYRPLAAKPAKKNAATVEQPVDLIIAKEGTVIKA
jgi:phosphoribosyl 1,2-cyclic phosphodiesterase